MNTSPNATSSGGRLFPVWFKIGAVLFIAVLAMLFFFFATASLRRERYHQVVPAGAAPAEPGPVVPH